MDLGQEMAVENVCEVTRIECERCVCGRVGVRVCFS